MTTDSPDPERLPSYPLRALAYDGSTDAPDELSRLRAALQEVVDAYTARFDVPGRGLVGPIDPEIEAARALIHSAATGEEKR